MSVLHNSIIKTLILSEELTEIPIHITMKSESFMQFHIRARPFRKEFTMGKLSGKTAIVTGAGRGLGKQIAIRFAEEALTSPSAHAVWIDYRKPNVFAGKPVPRCSVSSVMSQKCLIWRPLSLQRQKNSAESIFCITTLCLPYVGINYLRNILRKILMLSIKAA